MQLRSAADDIRDLCRQVRALSYKLPLRERDDVHDKTTLIETIATWHIPSPFDDQWSRFGFSGQQCKILDVLHRNKGKTVSRQQIWNLLYASDPDGGPGTINIISVHISHIRRRIREKKLPIFIESKRGVVGYCLIDGEYIAPLTGKFGQGGIAHSATYLEQNVLAFNALKALGWTPPVER